MFNIYPIDNTQWCVQRGDMTLGFVFSFDCLWEKRLSITVTRRRLLQGSGVHERLRLDLPLIVISSTRVRIM
jgi:hypothetical protein